MNKYTLYTGKTLSIMLAIENYLVSRFGSDNHHPEWLLSLFMLADDLDLYEECKKELMKEGIFDSDTKRKNPLLSTLKDLQASITKVIQHLGISPYASAKIATPEGDGAKELLENLIGDDEENGEQ